MRKLLLTLTIVAASYAFASAQVIPSFQLGLKGGVNFSKLSGSSTFNSDNRAGYLGGLWARVGALGFNFQPELYVTGKNVEISDNGSEVRAKFTSIDVPLLFGGKVGAFGLGARFYTGPLISFKINDSQSFSSAVGNATSLHFKNQNYAWIFGAGVDIRNISLDLRYEAGLSKQTYGSSETKINLFNLTLAVPIVKI
ncbi:MAG TPA: porin family protein [Mucilaginibacter sp.]